MCSDHIFFTVKRSSYCDTDVRNGLHKFVTQGLMHYLERAFSKGQVFAVKVLEFGEFYRKPNES